MEQNPYQSPTAEESAHQHRTGGGFIRYRVFAHNFFFWGLTLSGSRESLRQQAEDFINTHVGVENVISVVEQSGPLNVVVWYREA